MSLPPLKYDPKAVCQLVNPKTYILDGDGGTYNLQRGEHAIFVYPKDRPVDGLVNIQGDGENRIQTVGGWGIRTNNYMAGTSNPPSSGANLVIQGVDIAYLEGLHFDKYDQPGDNVIVRGKTTSDGRKIVGCKLYAQNCRWERVNWMDTSIGHPFTQHGDNLQAQTQFMGFYFYNVTFGSWSTSLLFNSSFDDQMVPGPAVLDKIELENFNLIQYDSTKNPLLARGYRAPTGGALLWLYDTNPSKKFPISFKNVWVWDLEAQPGKREIELQITPGPHYNSTFKGTVISGTPGVDAVWKPSSLLPWTGTVNEGVPPGGDFAVAGVNCGLGYVSPWNAPVPVPTSTVVSTVTPGPDFSQSRLTYDGTTLWIKENDVWQKF